MMTDSVRLCRLDELAEGKSRGFDPWVDGHDTLFVVRRRGLHGYRDACPHWVGTPMAWRKDAYLSGDGRDIVCSAHGARFDIETGVCMLGPCLGQSLTPVPLIINDDGEIHLAIATEPETNT